MSVVNRPRVRGVLTREAWQRMAQRVMVVLSQDHARHFATETAPDGTRWAPLKSSTKRLAVQRAIEKIGGRRARPQIVRKRNGLLVAVARNPLPGKQKTARVRRTSRSKILQDTGLLRASVVAIHGAQKTIRRVREFEIVWGTNVEYAKAHQHGRPERNLPARPFLGISRQARQRIMQIMRTRT